MELQGRHKVDKGTRVPPLWRKGEKVGTVWLEKVVDRLHSNLPVSEGSYREAEEGLFVRNYSGRTRIIATH